MKCTLLIILTNAVLLAAGVLMILISCIQYDNWWPLLTIFTQMFAITIPIMCNACAVNDDMSFSAFDDSDMIVQQTFADLSWVFLSGLIVVGYSIPILLYRHAGIPPEPPYWSLVGATIILISILLFIKVFYFKSNSSSSSSSEWDA